MQPAVKESRPRSSAGPRNRPERDRRPAFEESDAEGRSTMGWLDWWKRLGARVRPQSLRDWFHVTFDDERVYLRTDPRGGEGWSQEFTWDSVVRIAFAAEDYLLSDGIYVFTTQRPESYAIPTEADGGSELWGEILRRKLFDAELAIKAACSPKGLFVWPPDESPADSPRG